MALARVCGGDVNNETPKHAGGRPTDYRPEYCDSVVKWGKQGKSKAWMCAELDVVDQTLRNWCDAHPEFLEAITRGLKHSQKWWEDKGQDSLDKAGFQGSVWSRSMAARFPDDWREKQGVEHSGALEITSKDQKDAAVKAAIRAKS